MKFYITKRSGVTVPYDRAKLTQFLTWAGSGRVPTMLVQLLEESIKPKSTIHVDALLNKLSTLAEQLASRIQTHWLHTAGRIYMVSLVKRHRAAGLDLININMTKLTKMVNELQARPTVPTLRTFNLSLDYDYSLPINDVRLAVEKYAKIMSNGLPETPTLVLLRQALDASAGNANRHAIFSLLKQHAFTFASPMQFHAGSDKRSTGSCTLLTVEDTTEDITRMLSNLALHSKHGSGNGIDVTAIRAAGSNIGSIQGASNGVVPFIRVIDSVLKAWNQGGLRQGAGVISMQWWHADVEAFLYLKNTKGVSEARIRGLKYALVTDDYFYRACKEDHEVALVCPTVIEDLSISIRKPLTDSEYEIIRSNVKSGIVEGKLVRARTVFKWFAENRYNHGNLYETNLTNMNQQHMLSVPVLSSNLCTEISIPSDKDHTGLCFLSSTNIAHFMKLSPTARRATLYTQMDALTHQIETDYYPVPETTKAYNQRNRFIGIGMSNLATHFAENNIDWNSEEALYEMARIMDVWSHAVIHTSTALTRKYGKCDAYISTEWAKGVVPMDLSKLDLTAISGYTVDQDKWDNLRERVKDRGVAHSLMMAIAPTASSGAAVGLTEGIEPVSEVFFTRAGSIPVRASVNADQSLLGNYTPAFEVSNHQLIKLAAIRQHFLDQGQSYSHYVKEDAINLSEIFDLHAECNRLGIKTNYYVNFRKVDAEAVCESCS